MRPRTILGFGILFFILIAPSVLAGWRWSSSNSMSSDSIASRHSSELSTLSVNNSLNVPAKWSVLASVYSRVSEGKPWSDEISELKGPMAKSSATVIVALDRVVSSSAINAFTRTRMLEIRDALGVTESPENSARCTMKGALKIDHGLITFDHVELDEKLQKEAVRALLRHESLLFPAADGIDATPTTLPEFLAVIHSLASSDNEADLLTSISNRLFDCTEPDHQNRLRGAAALVFLAATTREGYKDDFYSEVFAENPKNITPSLQRRLDAFERHGAVREREVERLTDTTSPSSKPEARVCLAMSGGGVRSAAFQMGVLQGLAEIDRLNDVDIAAAVSGGSYTLGWLVSDDEHMADLRNEKTLRKVDKRSSWLTSKFEGAAGGVGALLTQGVRILTRVARTSIPDPTFAHYFYSHLLTASYEIDSEPLARSTSKITPFPIFVTTVRIGEEGPCDKESEMETPFLGAASNLAHSVFEITPLFGGTTELGFSTRIPRDMSMSAVIATAGAALDNPDSGYCNLMRTLGVTLGTRIGVWQPEFPGRLASDGGTTTKATQVTGPLYLSDGGFSDNLGLYPLLKRSCDSIIVADAGFDPDLMFGDMRRLQRAVEAQDHITIKADEVSRIADLNGTLCKREDHEWPCFVKAKAKPEGAPMAARRAPTAVFKGEVDIDGRVVPLTYLKLAVDETKAKQYPASIRKVLGRPSKASWQFPHIPTTRQKLDPEEFRALRHLGCYLLETAVEGRRPIPSDSPCQP